MNSRIRLLGIGCLWLTLTGCAELALAAYAVNGLSLMGGVVDLWQTRPQEREAVCCQEDRPEETP